MSHSLAATAILLACFLGYTTGQYQNGYDQDLNVECSAGRGLYRVRSEHSNHHEDRRWRWECREVATAEEQSHCVWYTDVNVFDGDMFFHCPANQFLAGLRSYHSNSHEDRRWSAKCCSVTNKCSRSCFLSGFINEHDRYMDHAAGYKSVFTGLFSFHNNGTEDRRWKLMECRMGTCQS